MNWAGIISTVGYFLIIITKIAKEIGIKKAIIFSSDIEKLSEIRNGLRKKSLSSPVFDSDEFSKDFSEMLNGLWKNLKN